MLAGFNFIDVLYTACMHIFLNPLASLRSCLNYRDRNVCDYANQQATQSERVKPFTVVLNLMTESKRSVK